MAPERDGRKGYGMFFSYARADARLNSAVVRLYEDLCSEVAALSGMPVESVGFRDTRSLELGDTWTEEIEWALCSSKAMVSLYSPTFFTREACGREWAFFEQRASAGRRRGRAASLIVPVLWVPCQPPGVAARYQYDNDLLPPSYGKDGLAHLLRTAKRDYYQAIRVLALAIKEKISSQAAEEWQKKPLYERLPNAFSVSYAPPNLERAFVGGGRVETKRGSAASEDPQHGKWGGLSKRGGYALSATVRETTARGWYDVHLEVRPTNKSRRMPPTVVFHLHPTFATPRSIEVQRGRATCDLVAWGAFTVGAVVGSVKLELDLSSEEVGAPQEFRDR